LTVLHDVHNDTENNMTGVAFTSMTWFPVDVLA